MVGTLRKGRLWKRWLFSYAVIGFASAWSGSAEAGFATIIQPDSAYLAGTARIDPGAPGRDVSVVSDGFLAVSFSSARTIGLVPEAWGSWSEPGDSESSTPKVLYSVFDQTPLSSTLVFSKGLRTFGIEIEPNSEVSDITVDFFSGDELLGSIARQVDWNSGARLFAATLDGLGVAASDDSVFTKVVINSEDSFAFAQVRYFTPNRTVIPEPASLALLGWFGALLSLKAVRRNRDRFRA